MSSPTSPEPEPKKAAASDRDPVRDEVEESSEEEGAVTDSDEQSDDSDNASDGGPERVEGSNAPPPLPNEPLPSPEDDGWDCQWDANSQSWYFHNRFTGKSQWDNPRVSTDTTASAPGTRPAAPQPPVNEEPPAGGYNPAIHGDYDSTAWYAQNTVHAAPNPSAAVVAGDASALYAQTAAFNRATGTFQADDMGPERHTDEAKSKRQMNAFFDVDAAANAHNGRSLKAERSNKKPSKSELKAFKEKRRVRKEEKRRAWLRD